MFRLALLHDISGDAARKHVALGDIPARRDDELDLCLIGSFDERMRSLWTVELRAPEAKSAGSSPRS